MRIVKSKIKLWTLQTCTENHWNIIGVYTSKEAAYFAAVLELKNYCEEFMVAEETQKEWENILRQTYNCLKSYFKVDTENDAKFRILGREDDLLTLEE